MNEKPQAPKRRVNPMLLLGTDADSVRKKGTGSDSSSKVVGGLKKESQPPLMEASDFDKPTATRRAFPSSGVNVTPATAATAEQGTPAEKKVVSTPDKVEEKRVAVKAVRVPVSGFNPFPKRDTPVPHSNPFPVSKPSTPSVDTKLSVVKPVTVVPAPVSVSPKSPVSVVKPPVVFPTKLAPVIAQGEKLGTDEVKRDGGLSPIGYKKDEEVNIVEVVDSSTEGTGEHVETLKVAIVENSIELESELEVISEVVIPESDPIEVALPEVEPEAVDEIVEPVRSAPRKVNPMFLAGEEREVPDHGGAAGRGATRVIRPNFILNGEKPSLPSLPKRDVGDNARKLFETLPEGMAKPRPQNARKIEANIDLEDWSDDTSSDTGLGLGGEVDEDYVEPQYSKAFHLTERDLIMMRFLARYRYAYTDQLARLVDGMPKNIIARLRVLEKRGFIRKQPITDRQYLWVTRKAGNLLVDINFPEIRKGSLSYATIAHTIGIANLGVELEREAGGRDLLGEGKGLENWVMPMNRWKFGIWGNPEGRVQGEMTVTEREVRQGQLRWRGGRSSVEMRQLVSLASTTLDPVELEEGQEGLFVVYGAGGKGGEHIPDLVVARERGADGKPEHIAIELELTPKSPADWKRILRNYRDNGEMYSKVYYFTHKRSISTGIQKANEEVKYEGLVVRKYVPINSNIPFWG